MECNRYAEQLDMAPAARMDDPYFADALEHAENCPDCENKLAKRLDAERSISAMMKTMAPAPDELDAAIMKKVQQSVTKDAHHRRRVRNLTALAASVLLIIGVGVPGVGYFKSYRQAQAVEKLCKLSISNHEITANPEYVTERKQDVNEWLTDRMGHLVKMPHAIQVNVASRNTRSSYHARRVVLGEHTVAAVEFNIRGKRTTLFSYYPEQYNVAGIIERPKHEMGYTVAFWIENGLGYGLVSEASPEEVREIFQLASR